MSRLSIVLHTHMPYVEGFGTWPFGEEWLWEAIATSYLPLLDVLDEHPGRVTLSLTPVLCDQLEAPGALERCLAFLRERAARSRTGSTSRPRTTRRWRRRSSSSAAEYAAAADALERRGDLMAAFAPHASWTSAATHAVLPLLATSTGVRLQLLTGVASHRERFGEWGGGLWLPECAHADWIDDLLEEAGARLTCVDWTDVLGPGAHAPRRTEAGVLLVPIDREGIDLVWARDGYPSAAAYRDSHRLTARSHRPWAVDGAPYDAGRARPSRSRPTPRTSSRASPAARGLSVVALDTELLGHFWHEGVDWLRAVIARVRAPRRCRSSRSTPTTTAEAAPEDVPATSWGAGRDLRTWSSPAAGGPGVDAARGRAAGADGPPAAERPGAARAARAAVVRLGVPDRRGHRRRRIRASAPTAIWRRSTRRWPIRRWTRRCAISRPGSEVSRPGGR